MTIDLKSLIDKVASETGVDSRVLGALVHQESRGHENARSPKNAMGLTQLMPDTARMMGVKNPWDPEDNLRGGAKYLKQQLTRFGSLPLALAAYNAGPGNVIKYKGIPPFKETQNYVAKIMASLGDSTGQQAFANQTPQREPRTPQRSQEAQNETPPASLEDILAFLSGPQKQEDDDFDNILKMVLG